MKNDLEIRTKKFALAVIDLVSKSIGANYREAARALSHDDFIRKIGICEKEGAETEYWLELLVESHTIDAESHKHIRAEVGQLLAILVASGRTAKSHR